MVLQQLSPLPPPVPLLLHGRRHLSRPLELTYYHQDPVRTACPLPAGAQPLFLFLLPVPISAARPLGCTSCWFRGRWLRSKFHGACKHGFAERVRPYAACSALVAVRTFVLADVRPAAACIATIAALSASQILDCWRCSLDPRLCMLIQ